MTEQKWDVETVKYWLDIAAAVDKVLPPVQMPKVTGQKWDIIREWYELLWDDDDKDTRLQWHPTNEQISMWEEVVLRWFKLIDSNTDKKIVWMHTAGKSWVKIGKIVHLSRQSVASHYQKAIDDLVKKLTTLYTEIS